MQSTAEMLLLLYSDEGYFSIEKCWQVELHLNTYLLHC